jgi:hypothetical protein
MLTHPLKIWLYRMFHGKSAMLGENIPSLIYINITIHNPNHKIYLNNNMITYFTVYAKNSLCPIATLVNLMRAH